MLDSSLMDRSDFFFFKQKTAYEIVSGDWSSDVCSSDLLAGSPVLEPEIIEAIGAYGLDRSEEHTSELQSPDTISYAVFCLKKKKIYISISPIITCNKTKTKNSMITPK